MDMYILTNKRILFFPQFLIKKETRIKFSSQNETANNKKNLLELVVLVT